MTIYVDASALFKRYVDEPDSAACEEILESDALATGRHTIVEIRRNLARLVAPGQIAEVRGRFDRDLEAIAIVELDEATCETAAAVAEVTGVRTLDAVHIACAQRVGGTALPFLTYDVRQAQSARSLGYTVLGA